MRQYIIRRVLISLIVLFGVSVMLYTLVRCMPSDYVALSTANSQKVTEEMKANLRAIYGLDKPIWAGYLDWLWNAVRGNLGTSLMFKRPVAEIIAEYAPVTFSVAAIALVLQLLVAIPLGDVYKRQPGKISRLMCVLFAPFR